MAREYPLFKGLTRPPLFLGVPLVPLIVVGGFYFVLSAWVSVYLLPGLLPLFLAMRFITKHDDRQFHLLWLRVTFRVFHYNANGRFWRASVFSPHAYFERNKRK